ncbi:MAG: T9SS type A sorting domain-containing protein [Lewinellaceae bacterium]|nr:T9SS type A sorting domain-containing protein [Lewinellaceae bacterium]
MKKAYLLTNLGRCWALVLTLGLISSFQLNATTCNDAVVISSLPFTGPTVCAGTNDITSSNASVCSPISTGSYYGGLEALFVFTPASDMVANVAYSGQTWSAIAVFNGCPTNGGACVSGVSSSASSKDVNAVLSAGNTYYIMVDTWPSPASPCPGTLTVTEYTPPDCSGATAIGSLPYSGALTCSGANDITASNTSCTSVSTLYFGGQEALLSFTPATDMTVSIVYSGQSYTQISLYEGCPTTAGGCVAGVSSSASSKSLMAPVTGGTEYFILVDTWPSPPSPCPGDITVMEFMPPDGDNCSNAQDLATLTSPYSGTTTGYSNDYGTSSFACPSDAVDRVFYIDVPPAATLTIGQSSNLYDSRHRLAYGGACPGDNEIACVDDPDTQTEVWINTTGAMQRVYWLQDGYTTTSAGDFTLAWDLVVPPPVPNDFCDSAEPIACGETVSGTTIGASTDAVGACGTSISGPGVWYTFTANTDSRFYSLSTCNQADFDTKISVYTGSCEGLVCLGGADDSQDCSGGTTELIFTPSYGRVHYVLVQGTSIGDFNLTLDCNADPFPEDPGPTPTNNDDCSGAIAVSCGDVVSGTTVGFNDSNPSACGGGGDGASAGVWYTITGNGDVITASLCGSGFDTQIAVYSGSCGSLSCVTGNDDFCGLQSQASWPSVDGETYYIYVDGWNTNSGNFTLSISCITPSGNDLCSGAIPVSCGQTVSGSTIGATFDGVGTCGTSNTAPGVWYTFQGDGSDVTVSTCNQASFDTKISIFTGSCGSLSCLQGDDDDSGCGLTTTETFATTPGVTYYILIHGFGSAVGSFNLSVTCVAPPPPPANDDCADAIELSCNTTVSGSTEQASADGAPTCDGVSNTSAGVWYTFVGSSRIVNLNTCGSGFDTKLSVYTGACGDFTCVASNDDYCGLQSSVSFVPVQGVQYYVLVHGFGSATGNYSLEYDCQSPLPRPQGGTQISTDAAITLFPNPAQDEINVKLEGFTGDKANILIHNSLGQLMMERRIDQVEMPVEQFNVSQLQSGMYFLTVKVEGKGNFTEKFMVGSVRP